MVLDLAIALLAAVTGFLTALWLLLLWVGDGAVAAEPDAVPDPFDEAGASFIPMPDHLKTRDEMVAWMTQELPRLTANTPTPRP